MGMREEVNREDSMATSYQHIPTKSKEKKKPNFMITSLDTGKSPAQFKMARNADFKLPQE